jgi:hypothetical protein
MAKEQEPRKEALKIETIAEHAKETLLRDGYHAPTFIAEGMNQTIAGQFEEFGATHEERLFQMFSAGRVGGLSGELGILTQVFFISEAWMSVADEVGKLPDTPPSSDPKRLEILFISKHDALVHKDEMLLYEIKRGENEGIASVEKYEVDSKQGDVNAPLLAAFVAGFMSTKRQNLQ